MPLYETKAAFLRYARKLSKEDNKLAWYQHLLAELLTIPSYQHEFLFDRIKYFYIERNLEHEELIASLDELQLCTDVMLAYQANLAPAHENIELFRHFLEKASRTNDEVYQWCALLAVSTYIAKCWREKENDQLRNILQMAIDACRSGMDIVGILILRHRQNLKRNIPRSFYRTIAQRLRVRGVISDNDYENLLGDNRAKQIDFFYRYADRFELEKPQNLMMRQLMKGWFYVPGIAVKDNAAKCSEDEAPYETFVPLKTGDELIVFSNSHEAVSYMVQNHLPVADYYFCIPCRRILTIMETMKTDVIMLPLCLDLHLSRNQLRKLMDAKQ